MSRNISLGMAALAAAMFVATASLQAQTLTMPTATPLAAQSSVITEAAAPMGPVARTVAISRASAAPANPHPIPSNPSRRDAAWMVFGGAAIVVGGIVGGDGGTIIMVTGGVIGLVGLWRYLKYA